MCIPIFAFRLWKRELNEKKETREIHFFVNFLRIVFIEMKRFGLLFLRSIYNISFMKGHTIFVWKGNNKSFCLGKIFRFKTFLKEDDNQHCFIIPNCVYLQYWIVWNTKNVTIIKSNESKNMILSELCYTTV